MSFQNNGVKIFTLLVEYNSRTGLATGRVKPNVPTDPHYISPVIDLLTCPTDSIQPEMINIQTIIEGLIDPISIAFGVVYQNTFFYRVGEGVLNVVDRKYDGALFQITQLPEGMYELSIEYDQGLIQTLAIDSIGSYYIAGPFETPVRMKIIKKISGSFDDSFGNSFE